MYVLVGDEPPALIEGPEGRSGPDPDADHGELVWSKTYGVGDGEQLCGAGNGWNELSDTVTFEITGSSAYVTITVDTTLSSAAVTRRGALTTCLFCLSCLDTGTSSQVTHGIGSRMAERRRWIW